MSNTPAGWYPQNDGRQRYWDGQQWTEHFAPGTAQQTQAAATPVAAMAGGVASAPRPWFKKKRILIPAGLAGTVIFVSALGAAAGGGATQDSALKSSTSSSAEPTPATKASPAAEVAKPSATPTAKPAAPKAAPKPAGPKIGTKVRDGKFQFVVSKVTCGIKSVGNQYLGTKAQGQFCRVDMSITNIGDEAQTMFADNQTAFDTKGRKFSADSEASIYDDKSEVLFEEINPGNTVKGRVYFDVPKGVKLAKVELHDSLFSGGVEVALTK
ncbi:DUF4352 domain-containing protein [Phycicoccus sp. HDW14]|uniref:DUF4352 domain-containing protein n=1 Tax=Phycicoccus sp. HDW14 TaxID=2714941 RepID=UPI00140D06BC|nr:DUF4352 domain-containing protein [Phycicoccus sp. HDW14]QIM22968.1 DUF4352 domain-containing protein [Phycicoccus sp. HDW14]